MILFLKCLSLAASGAVVMQVVLHLRSPYQFLRWRVAWWWLLFVAIAMVGKRLGDFWEEPLRGDLFFDLSISVGMYRGLQILHTILGGPLAAPIYEPIVHIEIDQFSVIVQWDTPASSLFGWTAAEAIGQTLMQTVIAPRDWEAHRAGLARYLAEGETGRLLRRTYAANARCKDGTEIPVELTIAPLPQAEGAVHFTGQIRALVHL